MIPAAHSAQAPSQEAPSQRMLEDQREANLHLVLATIQAHELTEQAEAARTRAEEEVTVLKESERELLTAALCREVLLGMIGHDLRNPLGAIAMSVQVLMGRDYLAAEDTRLLGLIARSAERMNRMIRQLFDFTHARFGGGVPITRRPTDLRRICQQAIDELAVTTSHPIRCELEGELTGTWDEDRLVDVLSNLIGNAVDYALPGTPVVIAAKGDLTGVVLEVRNQGQPIPAELLPFLFAPFRQGSSQQDRPREGHLGLGLYIAHEIVRAHGGRIDAQSSGGTTTFTIRLHRAKGRSPAAY